MIVYRSAPRTVSPSRWLAAVRDEALRASRGITPHDELRELLIEAGALEAAVADAVNTETDAFPDPLRRLREASCCIGRALRGSWDDGPPDQVRASLARAATILDAIGEDVLPRTTRADIAEGYAYYALYPEGHLDAARRIARELRPAHAVCIGIRGIGTSLSAAAVAGLEGEGCAVTSFTVRPRGHPFDRRAVLSSALEEELRGAGDALFVVADEGPGLSGSSFASVAIALSAVGVPDDRIVFLPSWLPDPDRLVARSGRDRWRRHRKFVTSFEALMIDSGRLARVHGAPGARLVDLSAGQWRQYWVGARRAYPAVQPQHERRKYLLDLGAGGGPPRARARLLKFVGLGSRGRWAYARALRLAEAGFAPAPLRLAEGFLATEVVDAVPLTPAAVAPALLDWCAEYLALLRREFTVGHGCDADVLREIVEVNAGEGLGVDLTPALEGLTAAAAAVCDAPVVALDGRMLPHEWLLRGGEYIKTDGLEHHDDHFQPGPHDIAWDLAALAEEFALTPAQLARVTERYRVLSGDRNVEQRLPLHRAAYLAFRLGYGRMAAAALSGDDDGERWRRRARRYEARLRRALASVTRIA